MNKKVASIVLAVLVVCIIAVVVVRQAARGVAPKEVKSEADALFNTALSWQEKGKDDEAFKLYQDLIKQFPHDEKAADALYKLAEMYEGKNLWENSRDAYAKIVADFPNFKQIAEVQRKLWDLNIKILFSPVVTDKDIVYKVEPGDTLSKIANKYNTTADLIMRSNNLKTDLIRPGNRLKVSGVKYSVVVDKSQNYLILKADDEIFKVYAVATGEYNCTPVGNFKIVEKLENPDWYKSGEGIILANNPKNILGTRWLGLSEPQYGIHGGASEKDLGQQVTEGCIRMINTEVEELFVILPRGTEVNIID